MNIPVILREAAYARLSEDDEKDPELRGENVGIQLDETELFRETQHPEWQHTANFSDNDISASAYSSEERPDFERLMGCIRRGELEVLTCTEVTRPFRRPLEAETVIDLVWRKKTCFYLVATSRGGWYDLRTSAGRKGLRDAVNTAAGESDNISDRVRVKKAARAKKGMPNGGRRPYGFEPDQITHRDSEIKVMREAGERVLAGEPPLRILTNFNERGITTAEGHLWTKGTLVNMLRRKRYGEYASTGMGIREHKGTEYQAVWKCVFRAEKFARIQLALRADESLSAAHGNPRKYLLVGYLYCGKCGCRLGGSMKRDRPHEPNKPRYKCKVVDSFGRRTGCGGVSRLAEPLEDLVTQAVLYRLDSPEMAKILSDTEDDASSLGAALDEQQHYKAKLDELIDTYYGANPDGLTRDQFMRAKTAAQTALDQAEREVEKLSAKRTAIGIPIGQTLRQAWKAHPDIKWRRKLLSLVIERIIIHPGGGKPRYETEDGKIFKFDAEQVEIVWSI